MFSAIIVDDELPGRQMLAGMMENFFPGRVKVMALCDSVEEALINIELHKPEVVFLDIEMPRASGFDLIEKSGSHDFLVVFVTAYNEYAVKAFKVNALDYLLKPVQRDDLHATLNKLDKRLKEDSKEWKDEVFKKIIALSSHSTPKIGLPTMNGFVFIDVHEIIRCEADSNYTILCTTDKKIVVSRTLREVEETLKSYNFFRVHKSHLANLDKVMKYIKAEGGSLVMTDRSEIPVSRPAKEELEKRLMML